MGRNAPLDWSPFHIRACLDMLEFERAEAHGRRAAAWVPLSRLQGAFVGRGNHCLVVANWRSLWGDKAFPPEVESDRRAEEVSRSPRAIKGDFGVP